MARKPIILQTSATDLFAENNALYQPGNSTWEGIKANFLKTNDFGPSLMTERMPFDVTAWENGYEPMSDYSPKYREVMPEILTSGGPDEVAAIKRNYDRRVQNRQIYDESTVIQALIGEGLGYALSPSAWIGGGLTSIGLNAAKQAVKGRLGTIVKGSAYGFGTEVAHQATMLAVDDDLTATEAGMNVVFGTAFGAGLTALGVGAGMAYNRLPARHARKFAEQTREDIANFTEEVKLQRAAVREELRQAGINNDEALKAELNQTIADLDDAISFASNASNDLADVADNTSPSMVKYFEKFMDKIAFTTPGLRLAYSPYASTRELASKLYRGALLQNQNFHHKKSFQSAEVLADVKVLAEMSDALKGARNDYHLYRAEALGRGNPGLRLRGAASMVDSLKHRFGGGIDHYTEASFMRQVSRALVAGGRHENKHVASAAKRLKDEVYDPMFEEMQKRGLVTEPLVSVHGGYLPRIWLTDQVMGRQEELAELIFNWQVANLPKAEQKTMKQLRGAIKEILSDPLGLDRAVGEPDKTFKGFFKERNIDMDDLILMDNGFIQTDVEAITRAYVNATRTDMSLHDNFGSVGMEKHLADIEGEWLADIGKMEKEGASAEMIAKMKANMESELNDIKAIRDIQRGVFAIPDNPYSMKSTALRVMVDLNNPLMLGGVTVSSIPDAARMLYANGIEASFQSVKAMFKNRDIFNMGKEDVRRAGVAMDAELNMVSMNYAMFGDTPAFTRMDRISQGISNGFFQMTLLPQWNDFIKRVTGTVTISKMLDDMVKWVDSEDVLLNTDGVEFINGPTGRVDKDGSPVFAYRNNETGNIHFDEQAIRDDFVNKPWAHGRLKDIKPLDDEFFRSSTDWVEFVKRHEYAHTKYRPKDGESKVDYENRINQIALGPASRERVRLLNGGIGLEDARKIVALWKEHGDTIDGVKIANTSDWKSSGVEKTFLAAVNREVNNAIVTPGSADKPLWMHNEWGKVIGQYKSFIMAAGEKIALSGLQYQDKRALHAAIVSVMLGSQVSAIKDKLRGSKPPDNVLGSILDGIDQSGITGWGFTVNNAIETLTGNNIGLRPFTGNQNPWTPSMKFVAGTIGGPTAGNLASLASIGMDFATGSVDNNTKRSMGKFVPGNNLFYVQFAKLAQIPEMFDAVKGADRF